MSLKKIKRDKRIKEDIRSLHASGIKIKDAIAIVADKYSLSDARTLEIWYDKKVNYHAGSTGIKLNTHLAPALLLLAIYLKYLTGIC